MSAASRDFIGQDAAWIEWIGALLSDRMHHAWLLSGPQGLGKRAFAMAAAAEMMAREGGNRPAPESDPDIIVLNHAPKDDKEAAKQAQGKPFEVKRNITVNQIRAMQKRLTTRPTLGDRRCVIINPADDLETAAVNALLKSLEEPPEGTTMILVTHRPARLLPTIRSRCRMLRMAPLDDERVESELRETFPETDGETLRRAVAASGGSPGMAQAYVENDLGKIDAILRRIVAEGDSDFILRGKLSSAIGNRPDRDRQRVLFDLARTILTDRMRETPRAGLAALADAHADLVELAGQAPIYNFDPNFLVMEIGGLIASVAGNRSGADG